MGGWVGAIALVQTLAPRAKSEVLLGINLRRDVLMEQEYRRQNTEVRKELDSVSCLLYSFSAGLSRLKMKPILLIKQCKNGHLKSRS